MSRVLFHNGPILTGKCDWLRTNGPLVEATGRGAPEITPNTVVADLQGRALAPGFYDAHVHLTWIALAMMGPDLSQTSDLDELLQATGSWSRPGRGPEQAWIVGDGFDETTWASRQMPTREALDSLGGDRPILIKRVCGHVGVGNSLALGQLPDGPHTNRASGLVAEDDLWALNDRLRPDPAALTAIWPRVQERLHQHGITSVHDVASLQLIEALRDRADELGVRITYSIPAAHRADLEGWQRDTDVTSRLRFLGLKVFTDGSLGARTAHLRQAYADAPRTRGTSLYASDTLRHVFRDAHENGWQLMVHAIGDVVLDEVAGELQPLCAGGNPLHHRIEHVEVTPADVVAKLAASGAWACVQPNFARRWSCPGGMNEQRLGPERLQYCNAYRSLRDAGVPLAFGSDCMPLGPLYGLQAAVEHPVVGERLPPDEALYYYTQAPAVMGFAAPRSGALQPGAAADLAIIEGDPFAPDGGARVVATYLAGQRVWSENQ